MCANVRSKWKTIENFLNELLHKLGLNILFAFLISINYFNVGMNSMDLVFIAMRKSFNTLCLYFFFTRKHAISFLMLLFFSFLSAYVCFVRFDAYFKRAQIKFLILIKSMNTYFFIKLKLGEEFQQTSIKMDKFFFVIVNCNL